MYNSRIGRRTRRISDDKATPINIRNRRITDEDDDDDVSIGDVQLTPEEVQGLLELLPYKDALIKIAKGEFEIERVEEDEEAEEGSEAEEENFEEDEDFEESESDEDEETEEDYEEEEDTEVVEDSAVNDAWSKRLNSSK